MRVRKNENPMGPDNGGPLLTNPVILQADGEDDHRKKTSPEKSNASSTLV